MTLEEAIRARLKTSNLDKNLQFPPRISQFVQGSLIDHREGQSMSMRFVIKPDYDNPFQRTFGGVYSMFFDATLGPFSTLLTGSITTSLDLNVSFIKSLSVADEYVDIKAKVVSQSKSFVLLHATANNKKGELVATCNSRMMILDPSRLN